MIVNDKSDNPERFFVIQRRFRPPSKIPCWLLAPRLGFSARRLRLILSLFLSFSLFLSLSLSFSLFLSLSLSFSLSLSPFLRVFICLLPSPPHPHVDQNSRPLSLMRSISSLMRIGGKGRRGKGGGGGGGCWTLIEILGSSSPTSIEILCHARLWRFCWCWLEILGHFPAATRTPSIGKEDVIALWFEFLNSMQTHSLNHINDTALIHIKTRGTSFSMGWLNQTWYGPDIWSAGKCWALVID